MNFHVLCTSPFKKSRPSLKQDAEKEAAVNKRKEKWVWGVRIESFRAASHEGKDFPGIAMALLFADLGGKSRALPSAPQRNVAEVESVPPEVQHRLVEVQNAIARHAGGGRNERYEAVVDPVAVSVAHTGEKMPDSEGVARAGILENEAQFRAALCRRKAAEIELVKRCPERLRSIFKVGCARSDSRARGTDRASRNKSFAIVELKTDPAERGAEKASAGIVHLQRVGATEVDSDGERRVHNKVAGWGPNGGVNRAPLQREPIVSLASGDDAQARVGLDT